MVLDLVDCCQGVPGIRYKVPVPITSLDMNVRNVHINILKSKRPLHFGPDWSIFQLIYFRSGTHIRADRWSVAGVQLYSRSLIQQHTATTTTSVFLSLPLRSSCRPSSRQAHHCTEARWTIDVVEALLPFVRVVSGVDPFTRSCFSSTQRVLVFFNILDENVRILDEHVRTLSYSFLYISGSYIYAQNGTCNSSSRRRSRSRLAPFLLCVGSSHCSEELRGT